jgi:hypothetical protein
MRALSIVVIAACGPTTSVPCRDAIAPGELVITEVFARYTAPPGESGGDRGHQWFELYNATSRTLDLGGLEIVSTRGATEARHRVASLALAPHQYATLGDDAPDQLAPYLDYGYGDELGTLADTGSGTLALRCGGAQISAISYGDAEPGHSRELAAAGAPTADAAGDPASWCDAATTFEPENFGTPRVASDCIPAGQCLDGSAARIAVPPRPGDLAITEVMASPTKVPDATGEWFEVVTLADFDLDGVALDRMHDDRAPEVLAGQACMHVTTGTYLVFARSRDAVANGGLPDAPLAGTFRFSLVAGTEAAPGDVRVIAGGGGVIDAVTWTGASDGAARSLDPTATDAGANDDPSSWCDATSPYGAGDRGTPGAPNPPCPAR